MQNYHTEQIFNLDTTAASPGVHDITPRQQEILDYLGKAHFASIAALSAAIFTSEATIRRDIHKLEAKGLLKSVYGGVVISEYSREVVPVSLRDGENSAQKERIAAAAAKLIQDNSIVIFDASSTVRRICKHIQNRKNLTIITNNLRVCQELKDSPIQVYCTGGALLPRRECFVGHFAEEFLRKVKADQLFFSSQGLSENGDITDSSLEEIALRKVMLENAKEKIFLCDSSKKNQDFPFLLCHISQVTKSFF